MRSRIMVEAPQLLTPDPLVARLLNDSSLDVETQRVLLLTLGGFEKQRIAGSQREILELRIASCAASAEHVGLRSAAAWCARQWDVKWEFPTSSPAGTPLHSKRMWSRNSLDQVMVEIHPTDKFLMGSPMWEEERTPDEILHWARLGHAYAVAETEVTDAQFQLFLNDSRVRPYYSSSQVGRRGPSTFRKALSRANHRNGRELANSARAKHFQVLANRESL